LNGLLCNLCAIINSLLYFNTLTVRLALWQPVICKSYRHSLV
jgi:hypothetical protein